MERRVPHKRIKSCPPLGQKDFGEFQRPVEGAQVAQVGVLPPVGVDVGPVGQAAEAFVVGFLRRDFGAAGLFRLADEGRLAARQVLVATVTMTLFIPCIANFFMIVKEKGMTVALLVAAFIFPFALVVGAGLNVALRAAGGIP